MWRSDRAIGAMILSALLTCGCESSNAARGAGLGALIGTGTGALVGHATNHTAAGALIGAGVGALSGGLIGDAIDESERRTEVQLLAATAGDPRAALGLSDVIRMAQSHVGDDVVIAQIRSTGSVFHLSANDVIWLKQQGVSDAVLREMVATAERRPTRVERRTVHSHPVYVVEPWHHYRAPHLYGGHWGCGW